MHSISQDPTELHFMEQRVPVKSTTVNPIKLKVHRSFGQHFKRTALWPFRKMGQAILGWVLDKARYEIVYLSFHGYNVATCAYVAAKLNIFDHLLKGPKTADELAKLTNANPENLYRILRGLAAIRFLHQKGKTFSLSAQGELLTEDHPRSLKHWALQWGQDVLPVLPQFEHQIQEGQPNAFIRARPILLGISRCPPGSLAGLRQENEPAHGQPYPGHRQCV